LKIATLERLHKIGLIAVIRGPSPELTLKMVEALVAGGVQGIEITYTTPNAPPKLLKQHRLPERRNDIGIGWCLANQIKTILQV